MKRITILIALLVLLGLPVSAQQTADGQMIVTILSNFHSGFGAQNDVRGFELERSYLGYQCQLPNNLSMKVVFDVGRSKSVDDLQRIAYVKNAFVSWTNENWKLSAGVIPTYLCDFQEKFWGYRYVMKSFQDEYKFGSSADLGISAAYQFNDNFMMDAIIVNGEGYKKVQVKDGLAYGLGMTAQVLDGLTLRLYGSLNEATPSLDDSYNLAAFAGYKDNDFSIGVEYNAYWNSGYTKDANQSGFSVYSSQKLNDKVSIYARADQLTSKDDWNKANDGMFSLVGVEIKLNKYIQLSPNLRVWTPKADGMKDEYMAYISCRFGL